jgi:hypothetical protein
MKLVYLALALLAVASGVFLAYPNEEGCSPIGEWFKTCALVANKQ